MGFIYAHLKYPAFDGDAADNVPLSVRLASVWETWRMLRKLGLIGITMQSNAKVQFSLGLLWLMMSIVFHVMVLPFKRNLYNIIELAFLTAVFATLALGNMESGGDGDWSPSSVSILTLNIFMLTIIMIAFFAELYRKFAKQYRAQLRWAEVRSIVRAGRLIRRLRGMVAEGGEAGSGDQAPPPSASAQAVSRPVFNSRMYFIDTDDLAEMCDNPLQDSDDASQIEMGTIGRQPSLHQLVTGHPEPVPPTLPRSTPHRANQRRDACPRRQGTAPWLLRRYCVAENMRFARCAVQRKNRTRGVTTTCRGMFLA
jgi:hypothetical protein